MTEVEAIQVLTRTIFWVALGIILGLAAITVTLGGKTK